MALMVLDVGGMRAYAENYLRFCENFTTLWAIPLDTLIQNKTGHEMKNSYREQLQRLWLQVVFFGTTSSAQW